MRNVVHLCDCMKFMKDLPDNHYDLAIVDPPYGIGMVWSKSRSDRFYNHRGSYTNNEKPDQSYFNELFRISMNQVIFGYNYFSTCLPETNSIIVWDKKRDVEKTYMSECELAWHSFSSPARIVEFEWNGFNKGSERGVKKIHPFQKPVDLYKWVLKKYAKPGDSIFDSHVGSGSIRIACHDMGFDFEGCEINEDYWKSQEERFKEHAKQENLFSPAEFQEQIVSGELFEDGVSYGKQ